MADLNQLEFDSVLGATFALGTLVSLGIVGSLSVLGFDLTATQSIANTQVANSSILSVLSLLGVIAVNAPTLDRMSLETQILGGSAIVLVGLFTLSPSTVSFATFDQSAILAAAVFAIESGGFWALATSN